MVNHQRGCDDFLLPPKEHVICRQATQPVYPDYLSLSGIDVDRFSALSLRTYHSES